MNIPSLFLSALVLVAAHAAADDNMARKSLTSVTVRSQASLIVECHDEHLPSQRAVGNVLASNNFSRVYVERERLIHTAHRACIRGVASVTFVHDAFGPEPTLAIADGAATR